MVRYLTNELISSTQLTADKIERLLDIDHLDRANDKGSTSSSFFAVTVPEGCNLALGDNRHCSSDSRVIGFVPRDEIIAKTSSVVMSFDYDNYYIPRSERFLHSLIKG